MSDTLAMQPKYVSIPLDIFGKVENTIDAAVYGYLHGWENSLKTSYAALYAGRQKIADDLHVSTDTVTRSLQRLETLGLIAYKRTPRGLLTTTRGDVIQSWKSSESKRVTTQNAATDSAKCGIMIPQNAASDTAQCGSAIPHNAATNVLTSCITFSTTPAAVAGANDDDGGCEPFESKSTATLPAQSTPNIPSGLSALASQIGPVAERWLYAHVQSGTNANDWRLATVLRETAGMNVRSPKLLEMKFNDLPVAKPTPPETAKPGTKSTPGRRVSGDGKRVSRDGGKTWEDVATPMPNMPHPSQPPPPQLNWSTGNHQRRTGTPLGGLLGERVVEMTDAEKQSNLGASTVDSETVAERQAKRESERAAKAELSQRRQKRAMDLIASGKTRIEATAICRAEGLMD